jgi:hypothetical protein
MEKNDDPSSAVDQISPPSWTFRMTVFTTFVAAAAAGMVAVSQASPVSDSTPAVSVSNAKSSLTLIYQNNLNGSDDKNHIGAIILDPVAQANAAAACASLNEKLISKATLQKYQADFNDALSYQDYAKYTDAERGYYIDSGVVSVGNRVSYSSSSGSHKQLPVLCTQSANKHCLGSIWWKYFCRLSQPEVLQVPWHPVCRYTYTFPILVALLQKGADDTSYQVRLAMCPGWWWKRGLSFPEHPNTIHPQGRIEKATPARLILDPWWRLYWRKRCRRTL